MITILNKLEKNLSFIHLQLKLPRGITRTLPAVIVKIVIAS